jgi:hypothetical protein
MSNSKPKGTCFRNDDGSVSHCDNEGFLTRITHDTTLSGRPKPDTIGYGPNAGDTYFGPKGGCGGNPSRKQKK